MTRLHGILEDRFQQNASQAAVQCEKGNAVTYKDLGSQVASFQRVLFAKKTKVIGVLSTRRLEAYVAVIASFMSNVRFVPLNPDLPRQRLASIINASFIELVVSDTSTAKIGDALGLPHTNLSVLAVDLDARIETVVRDPSSIAYQMFTSGSTGEPKGVPISYANLSHYVSSVMRALDLQQGSRFSQFFDLSFDLSIHDIFVGLASGGALCPANKIDLMMPHAYLAKRQIDIWFSVPLMAASALRGQANKPIKHRLSMALFCGDQLPWEYAVEFERFLKNDAAIFNLYGPTEATIAFTIKEFDAAGSEYPTVPLGNPFGKNRIAIETDKNEIVPISPGTEGQLLLAGPQVFSGYKPTTNKACFVSSRGVQYYRSGDIVRVEGTELLHLGRSDSQIKLRGYRIELGEVENAVRRVFNCSAVAAVALGEAEKREIGVAYVADQAIANYSALKELLPPHMLPGRWLHLDAMPVNVNGKIDRKLIRRMAWPA